MKLLQVSAKIRNNTKEGAERKQRIVQELYKSNLRTNLYLHLYKLVLPILKKYFLLFQTKKPLIQTMIDELKSVLHEFLACFVKPEALQVSSCTRLVSLDIKKNLHSREDIFVGNKVKVLTTKYDGPIIIIIIIKNYNSQAIQILPLRITQAYVIDLCWIIFPGFV